MAMSMSLTDLGFGEENQSKVNLNEFVSDMVRSKSCATTTNLEEENQIPITNKDETGKLLFPGQHMNRRSSMIN